MKLTLQQRAVLSTKVVFIVCCALAILLGARAEGAVKFGDTLAPLRAFFESKGWTVLQVLSGHYALGTVLMPKNQEIRIRAANCFPTLKTRPGLSQPAALEEISRGDTYEVSVGLAFLRRLLGGFEAKVEGAEYIHIGFENLTHEAADVIDFNKTISPDCAKLRNQPKSAVVISEVLHANIVFSFLRSDGGAVKLDLAILKKRFPPQVDLTGRFDLRDSHQLITRDHLNVAYKAIAFAFDDKGRLTLAAMDVDKLRPSFYAVEHYAVSRKGLDLGPPGM